MVFNFLFHSLRKATYFTSIPLKWRACNS